MKRSTRIAELPVGMRGQVISLRKGGMAQSEIRCRTVTMLHAAAGTGYASSRHVHGDMQGLDEPLHGFPTRLGFSGQRFVQTFPAQSGIAGQLRHAATTGHMSQRGDEYAGIIVHEGGGQIVTDLSVCQQMIEGVERFGFGRHEASSQVTCQGLGGLDVAGLGGLVPAAQQHNQFAATQGEVQPIALPDEDAHFADAMAKAFNVAQVAVGGAVKPVSNRQGCLPVLEATRPCVENGGGVDRVRHGTTVSSRLQLVNAFTVAATTGYAVRAVPHWAAGVRLPNWSGQKPRKSLFAVFLRLGARVMGGRAGGAARLAGAPSVRRTPVSVAHPIRLGLAVNYRNWSIIMSSNTPAICPHVEIVNGHLQTNSFKIAEHFGKNHKDVLRAIDGLECSHAFRERNFAPTQTRIPIHNGGHRYIKAYTLTRDGFTFLAMGFTGKEAAKWKEAYIEAFNRMEAALSKPTPNALRFLPVGEPGQRVLIRFESDGSYAAMPVPSGCYVLTLEQIAKGVGIGQDLPFSSVQLGQIIEGASRRLNQAFLQPAQNRRLL